MRTNKLYLVGFMGAGKTTLATALGARLDWQVEDIDALVESREGRVIADIFARKSEAYFREVERDVLRQLLGRRHVVVATGGGTFADPVNRLVIKGDGASIWLDVSFETVIERLPPDGRRPLAADRATMRELWEARRAAYTLADLRLDADRAPVGELVERVLTWSGF